jgi:hypothetical protein
MTDLATLFIDLWTEVSSKSSDFIDATEQPDIHFINALNLNPCTLQPKYWLPRFSRVF